MTDSRPDPDALLHQLQAEEARAARGALKIFFGASAGVGKTYAMLSAARQQQTQGVDVLVGVIETHGRQETQAMLAGLPVLAKKQIDYRGNTLGEFDIDGALERHPALILVDELAHSNVNGSRHPKRWQDVEELLAAGIDVYTTINVQHLESLNDVVGGITGIRVWETVPDRVFDTADEVVLVDLPPDELLQRLKEGKVYLPGQAERAIRNFFRKGNLIALRELSLRRTADRVDEQMQQYRRQAAVQRVWQTRESLLVCIGPEDGGGRLVRRAARLANSLDVPWHAVHVETPTLQRIPLGQRQRLLHALKLAQDLGAETATLSGHDAAATLAKYAQDHNLSRLLIGRDTQRSWLTLTPWRQRFIDRLGRQAPELDITQVPRDNERPGVRRHDNEPPERAIHWHGYGMAVAACVAVTLLSTPLLSVFDLANIVMLFLFTVVLVAVGYGRGPAVLAAFLSVGAFDFFFVPPRFSFAVSDVQYLLTFVVMLAVGLAVGQLTAGFKYQAKVARTREARVRSLYEMARDLSAALLPEQIAEICERFTQSEFAARSAILLADLGDRLQAPLAGPRGCPLIDQGIAQWAFDHGEDAGYGTDTLPASPLLYVPLKAPMRTRGVLALELPLGESANLRLLAPEQRRLLETFGRLIAIAVERLHYVNIAQETTLQMESERLRNSLLAALSHDLRTPLTGLVGLSETLLRQLETPPPPDTASRVEVLRELASAMCSSTQRLAALVNNLLDMARLQAGNIQLNRQWQPLEEVVGTALRSLDGLLRGHQVHIDLPDDLPLLEFDAVLLERVLANLLENAAKYTPAGSTVTISARLSGDEVRVTVADDGPGLPPGQEETIFNKFTRGDKEGSTTGVGLGLAICRAVMSAHGGRIWAEQGAAGGARFIFALPCGMPPPLPAPESLDIQETPAP